MRQKVTFLMGLKGKECGVSLIQEQERWRLCKINCGRQGSRGRKKAQRGKKTLDKCIRAERGKRADMT